MKHYIPLTALTIGLLAVSVIFRKLSIDKIHPYQLQIVAGAVYAVEVPLWLWLIKREGIVTTYDPAGVVWGVLCIVTSVAAAVLFSYLLKHSPSPSVVAMAVATNPLGVLLLSHLFLGEEITIKKLIGCCVTIAGLFLLT